MADDVTPEPPPVIEVVYALKDRQEIVRLPHEAGLTAEQAVARSGLIEKYPEIAERPLVLGLFGEAIANGRLVVAGDRIEICRPLRKALWSHGKVMGEVPLAVRAPVRSKPGDGSDEGFEA
jgi:putative ubiquitin-RnfH superfamily antitoxin RatB of RatAB toxin-antitoxin module